MPAPEIELEQALDPAPGSTVELPMRTTTEMTFEQKVTVGVLSVLGTAFTSLLAWIISQRSKENKNGEFAWTSSQKTIVRLEKELANSRLEADSLRKEGDELRRQRNEFESAKMRAVADLEIARSAAATATAALERNLADVTVLQVNWERSQRYIRTLRAELVKHGIKVPEDVE